MSASIGRSEAHGLYPSVNLSGRDSGMSEQLLNRAQVGAALEQMRRERVPQRVRMRLRERRRPALGDARPGAQPPADVRVLSRRPVFERNSGSRCAAASPRRAQRRARRARGSARARASACSPTGTSRVLPPLPSTRTVSASKSTAPTSRLTSSSARRPGGVGELEQRAVALLERRRAGMRSSSISTSSRLSTRGSVFGRLGAVTRSAGFCASRPSCVCTRNSARTAASLRATVLGACPPADSAAT